VVAAPVLETDRLLLRPFTLEDAPFVLRLLNEPSFHQYIGDRGVRTLEQAERYLKDGPFASYARFGHGLGMVALKSSGEPIGMCGLLKRDYLEHVDLGYAFLATAWGEGYAIESARAMVTHAHQVLGMGSILATVDPANAASIRLLEKLGFQFERRLRTAPEEEEVSLYHWQPQSERPSFQN
jgi:ribosomal-protein-alanine N-acetyltransferase